jgi:precorrin-3B synthase
MNTAARGACPGIATPMPTGDGLLARLIPREPIAIGAFVSLCAASQQHGNGIIEITQRGSLQIRGLSAASAPAFARVVASLEIGVDDGLPLLTSPLLGLDAPGPGTEETFDPRALVAALKNATLLKSALSLEPGLASLDPSLASLDPSLASLGPKVSVLIDGGGKLHLDAVPADIRLRMSHDSLFQLSLGGDAQTAAYLGTVEYDQVVPVVGHLLARIASHGASARAKDLTREPGLAALRISLAPWLGARLAGPAINTQQPIPQPSAEPIGIHPLKSGTVARGFALPFGYATAIALQRFARAAAALGASSIRPAPGRALLVIGLSHPAANELCAIARAEGFIVESNDPRRNVVACAGAPACASAALPTRQLAPEVAHAARILVGTSKVVHLSGCSKGCAHPGPAALTIVGPDHLIIGGRASDVPRATISSAGLIADIERLCGELHGA